MDEHAGLSYTGSGRGGRHNLAPNAFHLTVGSVKRCQEEHPALWQTLQTSISVRTVFKSSQSVTSQPVFVHEGTVTPK